MQENILSRGLLREPLRYLTMVYVTFGDFVWCVLSTVTFVSAMQYVSQNSIVVNSCLLIVNFP